MTRFRRATWTGSPVALLLCGILGYSPAPAADWSRWRGPTQEGTSPETGVFKEGGFALEVDWGRPLGIAFSGIAVVGDRAVTMFGDGTTDWLTAVSTADGSEIWRHRIDAMFPKIGGSTGGPLSMPVVDEGVVYGLAAQGHLFAVRLADGSKIWSSRIDETLGARAPHFGFTTTPLVAGEILFVETGGDAGRSLTAFNKKTGEVAWSTGDDTVGYQSPILAEIAGQQQIVAITNRVVLGLAPKTGDVLWTAEHRTTSDDGSGTPILLGDDGILVSGDEDTVAFKIEKRDTGFEARELWRANVFKSSFATPVYHDGFLYGFSGDFLTCANASTGEKVWTSRPPGGRGLILVDGHLVVFANDGAVVAAQASPEGYREQARVQVSATGSHTYPSFADGAIYVRNSQDIARVVVGGLAPAAAVALPVGPPAHEFERFVRGVRESDLRRLLVDEFMSSQERFPVVEDGRWVHFVYRGDVEDVAIAGTMAEYGLELPLAQIEGTDLYYRSFPVEPGARLEYRFNVDFEHLQPDPLNPRRVPGDEDGDLSEVLLTGRATPAHVHPYRGANPGRLESFTHTSEILGNDREVSVYLPPGYDGGNVAYPLALFVDGKAWVDSGHLPNSLNNLIGSRIAPLIAVFVDQPPRSRGEMGGDKYEAYVRMLTDELLPVLDGKYRTMARPESRAVLGRTRAGAVAAYAAVARPDVFGKAGGYSVQLSGPVSEGLLADGASLDEVPRAKFSVVWNRYDLRRTEWRVNVASDSRRLAEALKERGYTVQGGEVLDSFGWGGWRTQVAEGLQAFFPQ